LNEYDQTNSPTQASNSPQGGPDSFSNNPSQQGSEALTHTASPTQQVSQAPTHSGSPTQQGPAPSWYQGIGGHISGAWNSVAGTVAGLFRPTPVAKQETYAEHFHQK